MTAPLYPALYQVNTRVWMTELSRELGRRATLDDIPSAALDEFAAQGFDWIWLLSVWQTGPAARAISQSHPGWLHEFHETLPNLSNYDIAGSGFAIQDYRVHEDLGGDTALSRLRTRMRQRGLKLILDFVPNHMAPDHPWVAEHPDYFIGGSEEQLASEPQNYFRSPAEFGGGRIFAYGRDPYFSGWPDTIQLNYGNQACQAALREELLRIAGECDGLRCDMAMLVLPEIFQRTWGIESQPFWPQVIPAVRAAEPGFTFMAEVYWELEWALQQQGFDYAYDKRLYDRLREGHPEPIRGHFRAGLDFQNRLARFLENHDEPRAAATFSDEQHQAAAVLTYFSPGLRFFHDGQFEGRMKRISPHLVRRPNEPVNETLQGFYAKLLPALARTEVREGRWRMLESSPAWDDNWSSNNFICFSWTNNGERLLAVVNYSPQQSQCRVQVPFVNFAEGELVLEDLLGSARYVRSSEDLATNGLYLDEPAWKAQVFAVRRE